MFVVLVAKIRETLGLQEEGAVQIIKKGLALMGIVPPTDSTLPQQAAALAEALGLPRLAGSPTTPAGGVASVTPPTGGREAGAGSDK